MQLKQLQFFVVSVDMGSFKAAEISLAKAGTVLSVCGTDASTVFRIIGQYSTASGSEPDSAKGRFFFFYKLRRPHKK